MDKQKIFLLLIITSFWSSIALGQNINQKELNDKIESLIPTSINDTTPGLVIGVVHKGELIFNEGYGLANLSYGIPNDLKMVYNIGSVSKQFLGYAFAMLHVEGLIDIDAPVGQYLEDWPEFDYPVTVRNLLTHTSGYREAYTISSLAGRTIGIDRLTKDECLNVVRNQPALEFIPGSQFTYNSTAWVILAEILENATNQPASEWVKANIFDPLGMKNTYIESYVGEVIPNAAESYYFEEGYMNPKSNRAIFGAADIYSSIEDLMLWINNFQSAELGGKEVMYVFLESFQFNNGDDSGYALGIQVGSHHGLEIYSHTGSHEAFLTQLRYYPDSDIGIIAISNFGGDGWLQSKEIAEFILEDQMVPVEISEYDSFEMDKNKFKQFEGIYLTGSNNESIELTMIDDSLTIWGGSKLIPITSETFYIKDWGGKFEIKTITEGKIQFTIMADNDKVFEKVTPWSPTIHNLTNYEGDYYSEELETVYHLKIKDEQLVIQHRWIDDIYLDSITQDIFRTDTGSFIQIVRNVENEILGFNVNSRRTLNVFFQKEH